MSNLDLKDIFNSGTKLENFMKDGINNNLSSIPKLGAGEIMFLKRSHIRTTTQLIEEFASLGFEFEKCVDFMREVTKNRNVRDIVVIILIKLRKLFTIPDAPENWKNY